MRTYFYTGPLSGVSLKGHGDIMLVPGAVVQMPPDNPYTERLIRKGWLADVLPLAPAETVSDTEPEPETPKRRK